MDYLVQGLGQEASDATSRSRSGAWLILDAKARGAEDARRRPEAASLGTEETDALKGVAAVSLSLTPINSFSGLLSCS